MYASSDALPANSQDVRSARRLGIFGKISLVGFIGLLGALILGLVASSQIFVLKGQLDHQAELRRVQNQAQELRFLNADLSGWELAVLSDVHRLGAKAALSGESAVSRKGFETSRDTARTTLSDFPVADLNDAERAVFTEVKAQYDQFFTADDAAMKLYATGRPADQKLADDSVMALSPNGAGAAWAKLVESTNKIVTSVGQRLDAEVADADAVVQRTLVVLLVTFLALAGVIMVLAVRVARPIQRATRSVRDSLVALGRGDLTVGTDVDSNDEIGDMARATEESRRGISALIAEVAHASQSVATSSDELTAASRQVDASSGHTAAALGRVSESASEVSRNIDTVAAGTEEMTASIREIAKSANDAASVAASAVQVADRTNSTVAKLGESSVEIGNVVKAITAIAEQTNLLALNATIEAARAGEAGKGFAVVANEVKDLAQETGKATDDIGRRVDAIQADTEAAVAAISEISSIIAQINDTQSTIASAVEEQTATTNEMGRNVSDAAGGASGIASGIAEVSDEASSVGEAAVRSSRTAEQLAERAARLQSLVGRFTY